jgi:hypothetical protein
MIARPGSYARENQRHLPGRQLRIVGRESVDNASGPASLISPQVRTFRLAREWSKSYSIGSTQSIAVSQGAEFSSKVADIKTQVERRIERNYNMTSQQQQTLPVIM